MKTLYDFGIEVTKIREAVNMLEVKGVENASLVVYAIQKCNEIITAINEACQPQNTDENQNGSEEGELDVSD